MNALAPSRAIINLNAYAHNLGFLRKRVPKECRLIPVVKANAYGHGAARIAARAVTEGAAMVAVAFVDEAVALRAAGILIPILVLVQPEEKALATAVEYDLRLTLSDTACAEKVGELARRANRVVPVHCKIDTGMGRQGYPMDNVVNDLLHLTRISHIDIEAISTHFPVADWMSDPFTAQQIKQFRHILKSLAKAGIPFEFSHAANSAAIIQHPDSAFDAVRPGLATYGVWPSDTLPAQSPLVPVLRWETRIVLLRQLGAHTTIGYGRTHATNRATRIAVLPVGYADGYQFNLSNHGEVLIRGQRCPVVGRVSMDQVTVDVTDIASVAVGDVATLIGTDGKESISAEFLADRAGTIPYDILTAIGSRVRREYVE